MYREALRGILALVSIRAVFWALFAANYRFLPFALFESSIGATRLLGIVLGWIAAKLGEELPWMFPFSGWS